MTLRLQKKIEQILSNSSSPIDYEQIAVELADKGMIHPFGVMPRRQICSIIENAIIQAADRCPFVKTYPGVYIARAIASPGQLRAAKKALLPEMNFNKTGIITCYGQMWSRDRIIWTPKPQIFGCQYQESPKIDFAKQIGIYALHSEDGTPVYIDYTLEKMLGECLYGHTEDRLSGRWDRFSFYGLLPINEEGSFGPLPSECKIEDVMASMRSIIVEVSQPRATRRYFDYFSTLLFVQWRNPEVEAKRELDTYFRKLLQ